MGCLWLEPVSARAEEGVREGVVNMACHSCILWSCATGRSTCGGGDRVEQIPLETREIHVLYHPKRDGHLSKLTERLRDSLLKHWLCSKSWLFMAHSRACCTGVELVHNVRIVCVQQSPEREGAFSDPHAISLLHTVTQ